MSTAAPRKEKGENQGEEVEVGLDPLSRPVSSFPGTGVQIRHSESLTPRRPSREAPPADAESSGNNNNDNTVINNEEGGVRTENAPGEAPALPSAPRPTPTLNRPPAGHSQPSSQGSTQGGQGLGQLLATLRSGPHPSASTTSSALTLGDGKNGKGNSSGNDAWVSAQRMLEGGKLTALARLCSAKIAEADAAADGSAWPWKHLKAVVLLRQGHAADADVALGPCDDAPFETRLLQAALPHLTGGPKADESLARIYALIDELGGIPKSPQNGQEDRLRMARAACESAAAMHVERGEHDAAIELLGCLTNAFPGDGQLHERLGMVHLSLGNTAGAAQCFERCASHGSAAFRAGLLAASNGEFAEAEKQFEAAAGGAPGTGDSVRTTAEANAAICRLYLGRLNDSLGSLEDHVRRDAVKGLNEGTAFNMCTLYNLISGAAPARRRTLGEIAAEIAGEAFDMSMFSQQVQP